jgi:hypothetical protein
MGRSLRKEERIGLGVAFGLHVLLVLAFLLQPAKREAIEPTERMTVNLASEVGMEATAPEPVPESRAAIAPTLADTPAPAPAEAVAQPQPQPVPQPKLERPVVSKQPAPADTRPRRRPDAPSATPPKPATKGGGALVGKDFLAGLGGSTTTSETRAPANAIGARAKASLLQAIVRSVKPHWQPPSGPDVDQIVSKIRFRLNPDGSLAGRPQLVGQRGVNATNKTQAGRHGEQAIRAVQLAAPFNLPDEYYAAWKTVTLDFDWKLAQ